MSHIIPYLYHMIISPIFLMRKHRPYHGRIIYAIIGITFIHQRGDALFILYISWELRGIRGNFGVCVTLTGRIKGEIFKTFKRLSCTWIPQLPQGPRIRYVCPVTATRKPRLTPFRKYCLTWILWDDLIYKFTSLQVYMCT